MRWKRGQAAPDVIDARGGGGGRRSGGLPIPIGKAGGGVSVVALLVYLAVQVLGGGGGGGFTIPQSFDETAGAVQPGEPIPASQDPDKDLKDFTAYVFTETQKVWESRFEAQRKPYQRAKLVLYRDAVSTGCGNASSAVGPFYCPADQRVYMDLSFFGDMERQLQAPGDFAWAYVIAHEMGHHVQQQLGTSDQVRRLQAQDPGAENELSVRLELQADCYSGVWARTVYSDLEDGDIDEALRAAEAVGDDRLQSQAGRQVNPDSFTHGSSEQRRRWFDQGRESGEPDSCDTFSPDDV